MRRITGRSAVNTISINCGSTPWTVPLSHAGEKFIHWSHDTESTNVVTWERNPGKATGIVHVTWRKIIVTQTIPVRAYRLHNCCGKLPHSIFWEERSKCFAESCKELEFIKVWEVIYAAGWVLNSTKADLNHGYLAEPVWFFSDSATFLCSSLISLFNRASKQW